MNSNKIILIVIIIILLVESFILISSFQGFSSNYTAEIKSDSISGNASSGTFAQRISGGIQAVAEYISEIFSGRFGIFNEDDTSYVNLSICGTLTNPNSVHLLTNDVMSNGTCFIIAANGVTIDCQGYKITYANKTTGYAVTSNGFNNSRIQNCTIYQGNQSRTNCYSIYLINGTVATIQNNSIFTYGNITTTMNGYNIFLNKYHNSTITNNKLNTTGRSSYGIYLLNSGSNRINSNNITTYGLYGNAITSLNNQSTHNIITQNKIITNQNNSYAIFVSTNSSSTQITKNTIDSFGASSNGIYIYSMSNNTLIDSNKINTTNINSNGILISTYSNNNNITNNNISTENTGSKGIYILTRCNSNIILKNQIQTRKNNSYGIHLNSYIIRTEISNNTITSAADTNYLLYIASYSNSTIINNNIINSSGQNSYGATITSLSNNNNLTGNNITASGTASRGLYIASGSNNNEIKNNTINSFSYSLIISSSQQNIIFNNIFNSTITAIVSISNSNSSINILNTSKRTSTNIINGNNLGGNYWVNLLGTGFSQKCPDNNNDGICDTNYTINSYNKDFLALTTSDNVPPGVTIWSPLNNSFVNGRVRIMTNSSDDRKVNITIFQYSNLTVTWRNISGCVGTSTSCYWNTVGFSNNSEGYNIRAVVYDSAGNSGLDNVHYTIDRTKPIIQEMEVEYPNNQISVRDSQNLTLNVTVTDAPDVGAGINHTESYLKNLNSTNWTNMTFIRGSLISPQNSTWETQNITLSTSNYSGTRYPNISVYDNAAPTSNNRIGDVWRVEIDNMPPTYQNLTAINSTYNNTQAIFLINVQDNFNLSKYIFSYNQSGNWSNSSEFSITGINYYIIHNQIMYEGNFSYKFYIFDNAGNMNETILNNVEIIGNSPEPTIYLVLPEDNYVTTNESTTLQYYYINGNMTNCFLFINGELNKTVSAPEQNQTSNFPLSFKNGTYTWFVSCNQTETDYEGENVSVEYFSETRTISVNYCSGIWTFYGPWSDCVDSSRYRIKTDTSGCTQTETESCGGTTPPGGGGGCSSQFGDWENWSSCINGIQTRIRDDGCGNQESQFINCECNEYWLCSQWEACIENIQKRNCTDLNICNTTNEKPKETKPCSEGECQENWYCRYSSCDEDGYKIVQECEDLNNCNTNTSQPYGKVKCFCDPLYVCENWSQCNVKFKINDILNGIPLLNGTQNKLCEDINHCENKTIWFSGCIIKSKTFLKKGEYCNETYLELYEVESKKLVSRIREYSIQGIKKLDITLGLVENITTVCDYCYDEKKNFDEEGIDCGGPKCLPCKSEKKYFDWLFWLRIILWTMTIYLTIKFGRKKEKQDDK